MGVQIYMLEGAMQTLVTLEEVRARNIVMHPVPYLLVASSFTAQNVTAAEVGPVPGRTTLGSAQALQEDLAPAASTTCERSHP